MGPVIPIASHQVCWSVRKPTRPHPAPTRLVNQKTGRISTPSRRDDMKRIDANTVAIETAVPAVDEEGQLNEFDRGERLGYEPGLASSRVARDK